VSVRPLVGTSETSGGHLEAIRSRKLVLFIGSSIGNYDLDAAVALLSRVRASLSPGDGLLLGTDLRKDRATLLAAYDDAAGVTAEFNRNVLRRLNRELGADFDLSRFRHVARWNEATSSVEMHLECLSDHAVRIGALDRTWTFRQSETIHTESSMKYDAASVRSLLVRSGFSPCRTYEDDRQWFAVSLARVLRRGPPLHFFETIACTCAKSPSSTAPSITHRTIPCGSTSTCCGSCGSAFIRSSLRNVARALPSGSQ
jgi:uncharacterized SAM-dependent methyltransferase